MQGRASVIPSRLLVPAALAGVLMLLAVVVGCRHDGADAPVPSSVYEAGPPRLHVDDLPVGDPEHIRELLREHVVEPAAGPPLRPELQVGPIHCWLNGGNAWIDPATGDISVQEPDEELHDPRYYDPWQADAVADLPDIGGVRDWDVSPDGALALLLCVAEGGTLDPMGDPYGGVALWDLVAAPLDWEELEQPGIGPQRWTLRSMPERLGERGDPWDGIERSARNLHEVMDRLTS